MDSSVQVQNEGHSDHKIIHATKVARMIKGNTRYFKGAKNKLLVSLLLLLKMQTKAEIFANNLSEILDRHAPVKTFQTR